MNNKLFYKVMILALVGLLITGCSSTPTETDNDSVVEESEKSSRGEEFTKILTGTNWQGTIVYDKDKNDLTEENANFIGLAKYDAKTAYYEFFDKESGESRGDEGTFFITDDGAKRVLISQSLGYQAVVDLTEVNSNIFTYKRMGVDKEGNEIEVWVEHIPYTEKELVFTNGRDILNSTTGTIETSIPGAKVLSTTLWNGTKVVDQDGNDLTEENSMFISIAKFDSTTSKYEFFNIDTGLTRSDFGYYDVVYGNKIRAHVSLGENKYGAVLEITELNDARFTYKRMGVDKDGNEIEVFVEHEPYLGDYKPEFTF